MNYHKSTLFYPPVPYIHKVGNRPGKLPISTLSELWYNKNIQTANRNKGKNIGGKYMGAWNYGVFDDDTAYDALTDLKNSLDIIADMERYFDEVIQAEYVGYDEESMRSETPGLSSLRMGKRLKPGMIMTVEPGIYFIPALIDKWEKEGLGNGFINFEKTREYIGFGGIRIEDDMLITPDGNRMLGNRRAPATTEDIESYMHP